ncbi:hypothetical protein C1I98_13165 [Spongiactinospora gelatinilytica]|uniref:Uncharacterized protein n=1 Tax=Spongiactinospora gelatinilytica TaxID=2666298 RepID=A0A2W2IBE0_9ACTN|nr:DUF6247 family protein [Spongiactinospora gelatinilytica]PZG47584.1 hypothetical protein C1I98_13165 [Spongiactinospora gelatinilytica]
MSAQPYDFRPTGLLPEKSLRAIRAALTVPQDLEAFDSGLRVVLAEVRVQLDAARLAAFIDTWWLIACDSVKDPQGRSEMHERAAHATAAAARGEPLPRGDKTWEQLLTARGVQL